MLSTSCFTLEDDEDLDLDDEAFLFSSAHEPIEVENKDGSNDREKDGTTITSTGNRTEGPGDLCWTNNGLGRSLSSFNGKQMGSLEALTYPPAKRMSKWGVKSFRENECTVVQRISTVQVPISASTLVSASASPSVQLRHHSEAGEQTRKSLTHSAVSLVDVSARDDQTNGDNAAVEDVDKSSVLRKFPGPAGILPRLCNSQSRNCDQPSVRANSDTNHSKVPHCSTKSYDVDFDSSSWLAMCEQLKIPNSFSSSGSTSQSSLLNYTVAVTLKQAANCNLPCGKVPHLVVFIKSLTHSGNQASAVLKDPTGEIMGTVHGKVLEQYGSCLSNGATIVLKQASVFSPSCRKHYLNITLPNVVHVYPAGHSYDSSSVHSRYTMKADSDSVGKQKSDSLTEVSTVDSLLDGLGEEVFTDDI